MVDEPGMLKKHVLNEVDRVVIKRASWCTAKRAEIREGCLLCWWRWEEEIAKRDVRNAG
jgi:hypothetical protein